MVIAGGLGTGNLAIYSFWRCLRGGVVIKILINSNTVLRLGDGFVYVCANAPRVGLEIRVSLFASEAREHNSGFSEPVRERGIGNSAQARSLSLAEQPGSVRVRVECLIGKQNKPTLFQVTEPRSVSVTGQLIAKFI
jgi:hypothetical protein